MKKIPILFEDENLLFINKPAGVMVHGDGRSKEPTIADWILETHPEMAHVGEEELLEDEEGEAVVSKKIVRPGIVHRLDRDTTGVLVIAKNQKTFPILKNAFKKHKVLKMYYAIVYGHVKNDRGSINRPIARSKSDFRKWSAMRGTRGEGRVAVTEYVVDKRFQDEKGNLFTLLRIFPKTGRTHQIRVHLKAINHPIVSDPLYAGSMPQALGLIRPALHASSLTIFFGEGSEVKVEAPLPLDFKRALGSLARE